jgi:hypothetical protein
MLHVLCTLKEDFHCLIRANWNAKLAGNAPVSLKRNLHLSPMDIQRFGWTDSDAGSAMGTAIFMPLDILSQGLNLDTYFTEVFEPCL